MCLAIPGKIKKVKKASAVVAWGKTEKEAKIDLVKNLKKNDWVIVQNNFVVNKLSASQAQKIIRLYE